MNILTKFWIAYSSLFLAVTICSSLNANLHKHLMILIPWIKDTFRPALVAGGHPDQARDLNLNRLPLLETWYKQSQWYGLLTFGIQILMFILGGLVLYSSGVPYILLMAIVMLLGSMVMFFPRTLIRTINVKKAIDFYFIAYAGLMVEEKETS